MEYFKLALVFTTVLLWSAVIPSAQCQSLVVGDTQIRYVNQFGDVVLDCSTPDNSPVECRVGWLRGAGSRVQNDSQHTIYCNGSLEIKNVTESLVGAGRPYRCYDNRGVFEDSTTIFIELKRLPTPIVRDVLVVEGRNAILTCNVEGARPHPSEIKWCHNGKLLPDERFSELTLINVNRNQSGNYCCIVSVDDSTLNGSGILTVSYVDITNTTPIVIIAAVNSSSVIRFGCRASGVPMVTSIAWHHPPNIVFQPQPPRVAPDNASVTGYGDVIGRIEFKHTGLYICFATNNVTRKPVYFRLLVKGPPAAPDVLPLLSLSAYEAQISWTVPFDGHDLIISYFVFVWTNTDNFTVTTNQSIILLMHLRPNTRYQYHVVAENGYGNGSSSDNGEFTTLSLSPPSPPSNVQVTIINSTAVNISWEVPQFNSSVGAILYTSIRYRRQDGSLVTKRSPDRLYFTRERTVHNTTSIIIGRLAKGSTYTFIVCLGNKEGKGPCEEVEATTPKTAPSVPVVVAMVLGSGSIQISWSVRDDGGNPNLLYSLTQWTNHNASQVVLLGNSVSEDGRYLVDHLMPNTSYQFSVVAHSDTGDSPHGWSRLVITNALPPGIPVSLTVEENIVKWLPSDITGGNSGATTFYVVQYSSSDSPLVTNMITVEQPTIDLTGYLVEGSRYRVRVRAGNNGGLSDWSYPVMFTAVDQSTDAPVSGLSSSSHDEDEIVIAVVCTSVSVVIIVIIMIVVFCALYHKRQTILHTYKINSIVELDDGDEQGRNTYTMISDKPAPSNDDELPEISEQDISTPEINLNSLYQIDTTAVDTQMASITIDDDRNKTPSPLMILPVRIATTADTTDV